MSLCLGADGASTSEMLNSGGESAAKRARVSDSSTFLPSNISSVTAALETAPVSVCSGASREMLRRMLRASIATPAGQRHEYQNLVVGMLSDLFSDMEKAASDVAAVAKTEVDKATDRKKLLSDAACSEDNAYAKATEALSAGKSSFRTVNLTLQARKRAAEEATDVQTAGDAKANEAVATRGALQEALKVDFVKLSGGSAVSAAAKHIEAITSVGKKVSLEASLSNAFKVAAGKNPKKRSGFDGMVLKNLEVHFTTQIQKLEVAITAAAPDVDKRAAAAKAANSDLDAARKSQAATAASLRLSEVRQHEAHMHKLAAAATRRDAEEALMRAENACKSHEQKLSAFRTGPFQDFRVLQDVH